jgi:CheY-like chemotaxis protein
MITTNRVIPNELVTPRVLAVDDERQVHASLRLRLTGSCELVSCSDPRTALSRVKQEPFDLCIVDLHMPGMSGWDFIEAARQMDPGLGFVILSGYGTEDNLVRAIPLHVYDFIFKPLPDRSGFERQLPDWVQRTRARRRELTLLKDSDTLARELGALQIERDVEFTASESARDALLQSANLLTTIHALLVSATHSLDNTTKQDPRLASIGRTLQEAKRAAEAATNVTEGFFNSAYANRDTSPAHLGACLNHACGICSRWGRAEQERKKIDVVVHEQNAIIRGLSGIELLLLLIPALGGSLEMTAPGTTVQVRIHGLNRLDEALREALARDFVWVNRKQTLHSHPGVLLAFRTSGQALDHARIKNWLEGKPNSPIKCSVRGLLHGLTKCKGTLGLSVAPIHERFELVLALPT